MNEAEPAATTEVGSPVTTIDAGVAMMLTLAVPGLLVVPAALRSTQVKVIVPARPAV